MALGAGVSSPEIFVSVLPLSHTAGLPAFSSFDMKWLLAAESRLSCSSEFEGDLTTADAWVQFWDDSRGLAHSLRYARRCRVV